MVTAEQDVQRLRIATGVTAVSVAHEYRGDPALGWLAEVPPVPELLLWGAYQAAGPAARDSADTGKHRARES